MTEEDEGRQRMAGDMEIAPVVSTSSYRPFAHGGPGREAEATDLARRVPQATPTPAAPKLDVLGTYARFVVRDGDVMIQIVDRTSDEVLREIPPEEILKMAAELRAYQQALEAHRQRVEAGLAGQGGKL